CGEEPVAAAVTGEDPAGAVASVRRRRQSDDGDAGVGRAEPRDRPAPVVLVAERGALAPRPLLPPRDQARAGVAAGDARIERREVGRGPGGTDDAGGGGGGGR